MYWKAALWPRKKFSRFMTQIPCATSKRAPLASSLPRAPLVCHPVGVSTNDMTMRRRYNGALYLQKGTLRVL